MDRIVCQQKGPSEDIFNGPHTMRLSVNLQISIDNLQIIMSSSCMNRLGQKHEHCGRQVS